MKYVVGFGRFWYDFVVGEDWRIAAGIAIVIGAGAALVEGNVLRDSVLAPLAAVAIFAIVFGSVLGEALARRRR